MYTNKQILPYTHHAHMHTLAHIHSHIYHHCCSDHAVMQQSTYYSVLTPPVGEGGSSHKWEVTVYTELTGNCFVESECIVV